MSRVHDPQHEALYVHMLCSALTRKILTEGQESMGNKSSQGTRHITECQ